MAKILKMSPKVQVNDILSDLGLPISFSEGKYSFIVILRIEP